MNADRSGCRVVIIGLDGATFNMIQPLISQKNLPFFQKLMGEASYGKIIANLPLNSASNWTSLFSGKNPGKHNIFDFVTYNNSSYQPKLITNQSLKSDLLWHLANRHNIKTILLNIPVISEPEPLNGIVVGGMLSASDHQQYAYPDAVMAELDRQNYIIDCGFARNLNPEVYFDLIQKTLLQHGTVFQHLIKKYPWQLAIVTLNALAKAQHHFWHERDKLKTLYVQLDNFLNSVFGSLDKNTYFIIVSHHGFKPVTKKFFVNEWLWELGLLAKNITVHQNRLTDVYNLIFKDAPNDRHVITEFLSKAGITKDNIRSIIPAFVAESIKRLIPWSIKKYFPAEYLDIVWDKTQAYFVSINMQGININLKGREPQGVVEPGKPYEQLRNRIIAELYRLRDPFTFENVVDEIYRKEDLFHGDYLDAAPDIIFVPRNRDYYLDSAKRTCRLVIGVANDDYPIHAYHEPEGIFFITGPNIKHGQKISKVSIYDITPTVLHLMGIPLNEDFDGQVIYQLFDEMKDAEYYYNSPLFPYQNPLPVFSDDYFEKGYAVLP